MERALFSRCFLFLKMILFFSFAIRCKSMKKDTKYGTCGAIFGLLKVPVDSFKLLNVILMFDG